MRSTRRHLLLAMMWRHARDASPPRRKESEVKARDLEKRSLVWEPCASASGRVQAIADARKTMASPDHVVVVRFCMCFFDCGI